MHDQIFADARQKSYYETRFEAYRQGSEHIESASFATNIWWRMRERISEVDSLIGNADMVRTLHKNWLGDLAGRTVLDLGCFSGNEISLYMADQAIAYRGVDLSEKAVAHLNQQLAHLGRPDALAIAANILDIDFPDEYFDVIYAKSVLHHFKDLDSICSELRRLLKPGGIVITDDPLQTEPINRVARLVYRPFQSDREWEWPFTRKSVRIIQNHFEIVDALGSRGLSKLALPFSTFSFGRPLALTLGRWGMHFDMRTARRPSFFFFQCWTATMLLRKACCDETKNPSIISLNGSDKTRAAQFQQAYSGVKSSLSPNRDDHG